MAEIPPQTPLSRTIAKELKARGFRFCGPTTTYSLMQACGLVNDHLISCHRYGACAALASGPTAAFACASSQRESKCRNQKDHS
jgi:DNA-3-methyladenine glycosylase I